MGAQDFDKIETPGKMCLGCTMIGCLFGKFPCHKYAT